MRASLISIKNGILKQQQHLYKWSRLNVSPANSVSCRSCFIGSKVAESLRCSLLGLGLDRCTELALCW